MPKVGGQKRRDMKHENMKRSQFVGAHVFMFHVFAFQRARVHMSLKIWIDGKLVDKSEAKISVYDHGLLYGDGVFEGIRVYSGKIFENDAHLDRLWNSAKAIRLQIPV